MSNIIISQDFIFKLGVIVWIVIRVLYLVFGKIRNNIINIRKEVYINLFAIYIVLAISKVFFPMLIQLGENKVHLKPVIWMRPIEGLILLYKQGGINTTIEMLFCNLILLAPLIFFLRIFYSERINTIYKALLIALLVSCSIEGLQFIESIIIPGVSRYIEINDIICNTLGGIIGFYSYSILTIRRR